MYLSIEIFGYKIKVAFVPAASHQRGECFKVVIYSRQAAIIFLLEGLFKSPRDLEMGSTGRVPGCFNYIIYIFFGQHDTIAQPVTSGQ